MDSGCLSPSMIWGSWAASGACKATAASATSERATILGSDLANMRPS